jgi:hypothetical protein
MKKFGTSQNAFYREDRWKEMVEAENSLEIGSCSQ